MKWAELRACAAFEGCDEAGLAPDGAVEIQHVEAVGAPCPCPDHGVLYIVPTGPGWEAFADRCAARGAACAAAEEPGRAALGLANALADHYRARYNRVVDVGMRFNDITLKTPNLTTMVRYFEENMKNPVIVYDEFFEPTISTDPRLEEYDRDADTLERHELINLFYYKQRVVFSRPDAPKPACIRLLFPVLYNDMARGYLAIFDVQTPYDDIDWTLLALFANAALVEMRRMLDLKHVEEKYTSDFVYDLVFRKDSKQKDILRRARVLNMAADARYGVIAVDPRGELADPRPDINGYGSWSQLMDDRILSNAAHFTHTRWKQDVVTKFDRTILILHRMGPGEGEETLADICAWLGQRLAGPFSGMGFRMGVGGVADGLGGISTGYRQAMDALAYGDLLYPGRDSFVVSYQDSGLLKLFSKLREADAVQDVVPPGLPALIEYDKLHGTSLLETLRAYLDCNCNARKASEQLFVHYKTMGYRLKKIQGEFGLDLAGRVSRLQIELGLQMLELLGAQGEN